MVAAVSLLVDALLFLQTATVLTYVAYFYNQLKAWENTPKYSSGSSSKGSRKDNLNSSPYLAALVMTGIFE